MSAPHAGTRASTRRRRWLIGAGMALALLYALIDWIVAYTSDAYVRSDLVAVAPGHWPRHCVAALPLDLGHL